MHRAPSCGPIVLPTAAFATFLLVQPELSIALALYAMAAAFAASAVAPG